MLKEILFFSVLAISNLATAIENIPSCKSILSALKEDPQTRLRFEYSAVGVPKILHPGITIQGIPVRFIISFDSGWPSPGSKYLLVGLEPMLTSSQLKSRDAQSMQLEKEYRESINNLIQLFDDLFGEDLASSPTNNVEGLAGLVESRIRLIALSNNPPLTVNAVPKHQENETQSLFRLDVTDLTIPQVVKLTKQLLDIFERLKSNANDINSKGVNFDGGRYLFE